MIHWPLVGQTLYIKLYETYFVHFQFLRPAFHFELFFLKENIVIQLIFCACGIFYGM